MRGSFAGQTVVEFQLLADWQLPVPPPPVPWQAAGHVFLEAFSHTQLVGAWVGSVLSSLVLPLTSQVQTLRQRWVQVFLLAVELTSRGFKDC